MKNFILIIALALSLQSCFFVAGAAAGAAGVAVVYDHRKVADVLRDQHITNQVNEKINDNTLLKYDCHISVTTFNQVVLLTGQASTTELQQQAEALTKSVPEVARVYNQITIQGPTSSLIRASDAWITTKIKTQMLATKDLKSGTIKVVTEDGSVYLMGVVSHRQASMSVIIARQVAGVQKVVRIFQYTD